MANFIYHVGAWVTAAGLAYIVFALVDVIEGAKK